MDNDMLSGMIGQPPHYFGDYLFEKTALPNNGTITSDEYTLNNTQGALKLRGYVDAALEVPASKRITVTLQYKDSSGAWRSYQTLLSETETTLGADNLFEVMPVPSTEKRIFRLEITTDFDASSVKLTCPIEYVPR